MTTSTPGAPSPEISNGPRTLSILIPFDSGRSYAVRFAQDASRWTSDWDRLIGGVWSDGIYQGMWSGEQMKEPYGKPLGWRVLLRMSEVNSAALVRGVLDWVHLASVKVEFHFFSMGVGLLVVRAELKDDYVAPSRRKSWRSLLRNQSEAMLKACAKEFQRRMDTASARMKEDETPSYGQSSTVVRMRQVESSRRIRFGRDSYAYPIYYAAAGDFQETEANKHVYAADEGPADVYLDWSEARVYGLNGRRANKEWIDSDFMISYASWFTLVIMDKLVSAHTLDSFVDLSSDPARLEDPVRAQLIRLAYREAAQAARAIHWTSRHRDICLIERINKEWMAQEWFESVNDRVEQLTENHEKVLDLANKNRDRLLSILTFAVGLTAIFGGIKEIGSLLGFEMSAPCGRYWTLGISAALAGALFVAIRRGRPKHRKDNAL